LTLFLASWQAKPKILEGEVSMFEGVSRKRFLDENTVMIGEYC